MENVSTASSLLEIKTAKGSKLINLVDILYIQANNNIPSYILCVMKFWSRTIC
jgi:hypothetical protein